MYITVEEALTLPAMKGAILLGGKNGISRKITSVNIMEVPGISSFVKPEELIITTMYPIRDNKELQNTLVSELVKKGVSALSIVPLSMEREIPYFMIEQADKYDFPLIKLPLDTSFNEVINPILGQILERKHIETEYRFRSRIIDDLLQGKITSRSLMLSHGKYYGWNLSSSFVPAVLRIDDAQYSESNIPLLQKFSEVSESKGIAGTIAADLENDILILFPFVESSKAIMPKVDDILKQFSEMFSNSWIGIGRSISDIMCLSEGLLQAKQAVEIAQKLRDLGRIVDFEDLGIYQILLDFPDIAHNTANKRSFVREKLGILIDHDRFNNTEYIYTLQILFEESGNQKRAAKKLFIHHNTMRYRLDQIERLTNTDLSDPETKLELQIAMKLAVIL